MTVNELNVAINNVCNRSKEFLKLLDMIDGEIVKVINFKIVNGNYGEQAIAETDEFYITLPHRYINFVKKIKDDVEMSNCIVVCEVYTREYKKDKTTKDLRVIELTPKIH